MMERKYQLVAWTRNITDPENARLYMIPSLEYEMQGPFIEEIGRCQQEAKKHGGRISPELARRFVRVYEQNAGFEFLLGHHGAGVRWLCIAALYCIWEDDCNWAYHDNDLGRYSRFCGELRHEFVRLCEKALALARKYRCEYVLQEKSPKRMMDYYLEHTCEDRDLQAHLKEVACWK